MKCDKFDYSKDILGRNKKLMDLNLISAAIGWWDNVRAVQTSGRTASQVEWCPTPNQYPALHQRHMEEKKTQKKRKTQKQERFLLAKKRKRKKPQQSRLIKSSEYDGKVASTHQTTDKQAKVKAPSHYLQS